MNKKILLLSVICLVLLAGGVFLSYENFNRPIVTTEIKDSPFSVLLQNATETFSENTDWYETKIDYPKNNQKIRDMIFAEYKNFTDETGIKKYGNLQEAKEGLQINVDGLKYSFSAEYSLYSASNTISYVYQIYNFTGGAHGSVDIYPIVINEKMEIVPIEIILPEANLAKIAKLAEADIRSQKRERLKSYGSMSDKDIEEYIKNDDFITEGVKPTRDNYSKAWYDSNDVVISFGQYQVGPYAEGMYEVRIPRNQI